MCSVWWWPGGGHREENSVDGAVVRDPPQPRTQHSSNASQYLAHNTQHTSYKVTIVNGACDEASDASDGTAAGLNRDCEVGGFGG